MPLLNNLGITAGSSNIAATVFESLFPSFFDVQYATPSEYVQKYWNKYLEQRERNNNLNGKVFEYILSTLLVRENILPLYLNAKVAFVPNIIFDLMIYSAERGPICLSAKTSLRERYKQADLEAIALKYVHRKALSYLITLDESEAYSVKEKIKTGSVIGLDDVFVATDDYFDGLISELKNYAPMNPPTVQAINSNQVVTKDKVEALKS